MIQTVNAETETKALHATAIELQRNKTQLY